MLRETLDRLLRRRDLAEADAGDLLGSLAGDAVPEALAGAILAALRAKGETPSEIRGFARAMEGRARRPAVPEGIPAVDIVGTGGDGSGSLNLSTGSALLAAACGAKVIKHGNRSVSSRCGSADVIEALGLRLPLDEQGAGRLFERTGFTFLFAPHYHPALASLAAIRRTLGVRTVFNLLGPLTNPARPPFRVVGAFSSDSAALLARVLSGLPIRRCFVIHGAGGWDEPTPLGPFTLYDVRPGRVRRSRRDPREVGMPRCRISDLLGGEAAENARRLGAALSGEQGPLRDALVLGASLALEVTGAAAGARAAVAWAGEVADRGTGESLIGRLKEAGDG